MAGSAPCLPVAVDRYPGGHCISLRAMAWRRHEILGPRRSRCRAAWSHAALCATPRAALRSLAPRVLRQAEAALALRQACGSPGHPERLLRAGQLGEPACRSLDYSTKVIAAQRLGDAPLREEHRWWLQLPAVLGAMVSQFIGWGGPYRSEHSQRRRPRDGDRAVRSRDHRKRAAQERDRVALADDLRGPHGAAHGLHRAAQRGARDRH